MSKTDPKRIWLQSAEDTDERLWCEDKVWPDSDEDHEPTEYIRADLAVDRIGLVGVTLEITAKERAVWKTMLEKGSWISDLKSLSLLRDLDAALLALSATETALRANKEAVQLRFDVPPEHETEPILFHKGWEACARAIYAVLSRKEEKAE